MSTSFNLTRDRLDICNGSNKCLTKKHTCKCCTVTTIYFVCACAFSEMPYVRHKLDIVSLSLSLSLFIFLALYLSLSLPPPLSPLQYCTYYNITKQSMCMWMCRPNKRNNYKSGKNFGAAIRIFLNKRPNENSNRRRRRRQQRNRTENLEINFFHLLPLCQNVQNAVCLLSFRLDIRKFSFHLCDFCCCVCVFPFSELKSN